MIKLLHISLDEKFIDYSFWRFDNTEGLDNSFWVYDKANTGVLKHIKNFNDRVTVLNKEGLFNDATYLKLFNYDYVIIHFMISDFALFILGTNYSNFIWFSWGSDLYDNHPSLRDIILQPKTKAIFNRYRIAERIRFTLQKNFGALFGIQNTYKLQEKCLKQIKYVSTVIPSDFDLIKRFYRNSDHLKSISYSYGDLDSTLMGLERISGSNILLGNSSFYSNNLIEAIDILETVPLDDRKVINILSYGNSKYANKVYEYGKKHLKENYKPIREFMPLKDYLMMISSCEYVIMNHMRQQAMGNIYAMLYLGAKVYLQKDNPVYNYLDDMGFSVGSVHQLQMEKKLEPLNEEQKQLNKMLIESLLGKDNIEEQMKTFVETLTEYK